MRIDVRRGVPLMRPPDALPNADPRSLRVVRPARSVLCIVGTRPEVIKMAPVIRPLRGAAGRLAQLHFCRTPRAVENLLAERVHAAAAQLTGNTVIDALQFTTAKLQTRAVRAFDHDIVLTAHRRENFGAPLAEIFGAL